MYESSIPPNRRANGIMALTLGLTLIAEVASGAAPAYVNVVEHSAECATLDLLLTSPSTGVIRARRCDDCPLLTLEVDADTRVFRGRSPVPLSEADNNRDRSATVLFDPQSLRVTRILLRQ